MIMSVRGVVLALSAVLVTAGCAAIQKSGALATERDLAAAGFQMKYARSSEQLAKVRSLPQRRLTPTTGPDGQNLFVWADAADCKCIYVGSAAAYDRYQRLSAVQQIAWENEMASMNWGVWGPWGPWW
jgi:hypothetical protein